MNVTEIMRPHGRGLVLSADDYIRNVLKIMGGKHVNVMPVADGFKFVGVLTLADIVRRCHTYREQVWQVMSPEVTCCTTDYTIQQAADLMRAPGAYSLSRRAADKSFNQLPVLNAPVNNVKHLVGMVYRVDVLEALLAVPA